MKKHEIAQTAANLVGGNRNTTHGNALENHQKIAAVWNGILIAAGKRSMLPLDAHDVANMMEGLKIARRYLGAGYAAVAGEIAGDMAEQDRVNQTRADAANEGCPVDTFRESLT